MSSLKVKILAHKKDQQNQQNITTAINLALSCKCCARHSQEVQDVAFYGVFCSAKPGQTILHFTKHQYNKQKKNG
jgi:hypothetical protein